MNKNNEYETEASGLDGCRGILTAMIICVVIISVILLIL